LAKVFSISKALAYRGEIEKRIISKMFFMLLSPAGLCGMKITEKFVDKKKVKDCEKHFICSRLFPNNGSIMVL
jgi:hypothetical protein